MALVLTSKHLRDKELVICQVNDYPLMLTVNDASIAIAMGVFRVDADLTFYSIGSKIVPAAQLTLLCVTEVILGPFWVWLFLGVYTLIGGVILMLAIGFNAVGGLLRKSSS